MVGQSGSQGGGAVNPMSPPSASNRQGQTQTIVKRTEVVDRTDQIQSRLQRLRCAQQRPAAASQARQALSEGGIQPFDASGVNGVCALRPVQQVRDEVGTPLNDTTFDRQAFSRSSLDDLNDSDVRPGEQVRSASSSGGQRRTKAFPDGGHVVGQAIHRPHQWCSSVIYVFRVICLSSSHPQHKRSR
jgi:hypothetical protein